jgi:hypothetical protein
MHHLVPLLQQAATYPGIEAIEELSISQMI